MALDMAAIVSGIINMSSRPPSTGLPGGVEEIVTVVCAPLMRNTPSTLPTRSTTAIVATCPRACPSATAWAMICPVSVVERDSLAAAQRLVQTGGALLRCGPVPEPVPPPQAFINKTSAISASRGSPGLAKHSL